MTEQKTHNQSLFRKKIYQMLGAALLMLVASVASYANDFPPIDENQVQERMMVGENFGEEIVSLRIFV